MHAVAQALFVGGMTAAAGSDLRWRRIPNWLNVAIAAAGLGVQAVTAGLGGVGA